MLPITKVGEVLEGYQAMMNSHFDELTEAVRLWASNPNTIQREDNGYYSIVVQGNLDTVITKLKEYVEKLEKTKAATKTND